jgi:hypothetical protein
VERGEIRRRSRAVWDCCTHICIHTQFWAKVILFREVLKTAQNGLGAFFFRKSGVGQGKNLKRTTGLLGAFPGHVDKSQTGVDNNLSTAVAKLSTETGEVVHMNNLWIT